MTKPVTRVTYDMRDFLESCVDRCCELAKVERKTLKPAATPFHELRVALPIASEEEKAGRLQPIASKVLNEDSFRSPHGEMGFIKGNSVIGVEGYQMESGLRFGASSFGMLHKLFA